MLCNGLKRGNSLNRLAMGAIVRLLKEGDERRDVRKKVVD
jgi:hypothetical protein